MKKLLLVACLLLIISKGHGSVNWNVSYTGVQNVLKCTYFINSNTGFVAGNGVILKTTNGGSNWAISTTRYNLDRIYFLDSQTGFAAGNINDSGFVIKTTNGGSAWNSTYISGFSSDREYTDLVFKDANTGYLSSKDYENIYFRTTNGGTYWVPKYGTTQYLKDAKWIGNLFYKIGSQHYEFYKPAYWTSTDEINWNDPVSCTECENDSKGLSFFAFDTVSYFVTITANPEYINIYRKSQYHPTWTNLTGGYYDLGNGNYIHSAGTDYTTSNTYIYSSSNSGYNWRTDTVPDFRVRSLYFINQNIGFATGENGLIAKTTNGGGVIGIQSISSEIPIDFSLRQNYPNPFNPSTQIEFAVPKNSSLITLSVYDINGRLVEKLVDEKLNAGSYKVDFTGGAYASGIYYYQLVSGSYIKTKKMILLK